MVKKPKVEASTVSNYTEITYVYILDLCVFIKEEWQIEVTPLFLGSFRTTLRFGSFPFNIFHLVPSYKMHES